MKVIKQSNFNIEELKNKKSDSFDNRNTCPTEQLVCPDKGLCKCPAEGNSR